MSLERFRRTRMVVLAPNSMAYQAARAMADNHIGSVLVSEARGLAEILTDRDLALPFSAATSTRRRLRWAR
jgi:hypothetical protein